jgi:hypothetical protein
MAADTKTEMREMLGLVPGFFANLPRPLLDSEWESIRGLRWGGDRLRMGLVLHMIAGALAAARPASAATIQGAAEANVVAPPSLNARIALGDERVRELRARGADMDWDQAVAYTITQATQALNDLGSESQP